MYNPINRALKVTQDSGNYRRLRPHWAVRALELASFLSFFPGMFLFLYAFILSAAALFASFEIEKGNYSLAVAIFTVANILPGVVGILIAIFEESLFFQGIAIAVIYGGLGIWGVSAVVIQKKERANAS